MAGLNDQSAFETFERMAEKIEETERRALAAPRSARLSGDTLEQEFARLKPADESVEFRLLELKQKMGMSLPAGGRQALPGGAQGSEGQRKRQIGSGEDGPIHAGTRRSRKRPDRR
jgi:phage shock protein A